MGQFNISITATGGHGCERRASAGQKLWGRCQRFSCPDCLAYDFTQTLRQKGFVIEAASFTHWPSTPQQVVDDLAHNERKEGSF
jgi:hypothetical protein